MDSQRPEPWLVVDGVSKAFRTHAGWRRRTVSELWAVRHVSFQLPRGGSLGLVGESGSGKTTIARMIAGLEQPTSGSIELGGAQIRVDQGASERKAHARNVQMVFQDPYTSLDPHLSIVDMLDEVQRLHFDRSPRDRRARTTELSNAVELTARDAQAKPRQLSGGQRQRAAIARALAAEPGLLILDEAVSALDVSVQAQVINLFNDLRAAFHLTYLSISHDLAVIRQIADDVSVLYRGRLVEQGSVADVLDNAQHPYTRCLRASVPEPGKPLPRVTQKGESSDDGCVFRHRCPAAGPECAVEPELLEVAPGHTARCIRAGHVSRPPSGVGHACVKRS